MGEDLQAVRYGRRVFSRCLLFTVGLRLDISECTGLTPVKHLKVGMRLDISECTGLTPVKHLKVGLRLDACREAQSHVAIS